MKIFIGLVEIAGYYANLKKGFEQLGIECTFVDLNNHKFRYGGDDNPLIVSWIKKTILKIRFCAAEGLKIRKLIWMAIIKVLKILFFIWALFRHDVFIFGYGSSFFGVNVVWLRHCELPVIKLFRKKIIFIFAGSDSRPPYMNGGIMTTDKKITIENCIELTAQKKKDLYKINKYADVIIDYPTQGLFHERPFVYGLFIGTPFQRKDFSVCLKERKAIRILHAPSHPEAKGSGKIHKAIENLKSKGYSIEFIEIINMANSVVLEQLAQCDFVVDQMYSDTPMAIFATEAASFGKPAIVGGYAQSQWENILLVNMIPPTHYCLPDEFEQAIEKLIVDETYRIELGKRAKEFVQKKWNPEKVAERYLRLIKGDIPASWFYQPSSCSYVHGWGLNEERAKELIRKVVMHGGRQALQLADKPELEKRMLDFAGL